MSMLETPWGVSWATRLLATVYIFPARKVPSKLAKSLVGQLTLLGVSNRDVYGSNSYSLVITIKFIQRQKRVPPLWTFSYTKGPFELHLNLCLWRFMYMLIWNYMESCINFFRKRLIHYCTRKFNVEAIPPCLYSKCWNFGRYEKFNAD